MDVPSESQLELFRLRYRLMLVENLVLKLALLEPVQHRQLSLRESVGELTGWLDRNSEKADSSYGRAFGEPALAALYADEAKEVVESMRQAERPNSTNGYTERELWRWKQLDGPQIEKLCE